MIAYQHTFEQDALLLTWYQELIQSGDMVVTFMPSSYPLSKWFEVFRTAELVYEADEKGIWWAAWVEPSFGISMYSMWCRTDKRRSLRNATNTKKALHAALTLRGTVFGVTCQPSLLELHRRMGYTVVGEVPGLWEGRPAWLVSLTREGFEKGCFHGRKKVEFTGS